MTLARQIILLTAFLFVCFTRMKAEKTEKPPSLIRNKPGNYGFAHFVRHDNSVLNVSAALTALVLKPGECGFICAQYPKGFSFNFALNSDEQRRHVCEVLSTDKYKDSAKFLTNKTGFVHYSIKVRYNFILKKKLFCNLKITFGRSDRSSLKTLLKFISEGKFTDSNVER